MEHTLKYILLNGYKEDMMTFMQRHPEKMEELVKLALNNKQRLSPRAAWLLGSCMDENDTTVAKYIPEIIDALSIVPDGHKRDLINVLRRMKLNEEYDGRVFDICINIWSKLNQIPSVRYNALRLALQIADKHPELLGELIFLTQDNYLETLSPGIKRSIQGWVKDFKKRHTTRE